MAHVPVHRGFNLSSPVQAQKPMAQVLKVSLSVINIECLMKNRQKKVIQWQTGGGEGGPASG